MIDQDYEYGLNDDYYSADKLADLGVIWPDDLSQAMKDVMAERDRQSSAEGWTPEHDDGHKGGELTRAAVSYCGNAGAAMQLARDKIVPLESLNYAALVGKPPSYWPWSREWWKPKDPRRDLVRAAALIIAEIDRLDRAVKAEPAP